MVEMKMKLEDRVKRTIAKRKGVVILRSELYGLGSPGQLGRVLAKLVKAGLLVRVSVGVYAKTRVNKFSCELAPAAPFETIAAEVFRKLKIEVDHGALARDYNEGKTTQVSILPVVNTGSRRITRKIQVGSKTVIYERNRASKRKERT
jgi:Family of unknown function (DUF6088)